MDTDRKAAIATVATQNEALLALGEHRAREIVPAAFACLGKPGDGVMSEGVLMLAPRPAARLKVIVSHCVPLICAGLLSILSQASDCEVSVWDDALRRQYGSLRAAGADVVLSDPDQGACLLEDAAESNEVGRAGGPRVIVVGARDKEPALRAAMERGIAARISFSCDEQDVIDAVRNVGATLRGHPPWIAHPEASAQGGLAPHALRKVTAHVREKIAEKIDIADLAGIAGLSASHFARAFKQSMGITPHQYLRWRRVQLAARMLRDTKQPLAQICLAVGCCNQSHFTRLFVSMMGETPGAYRRRSR